jgi:hypothetical protein
MSWTFVICVRLWPAAIISIRTCPLAMLRRSVVSRGIASPCSSSLVSTPRLRSVKRVWKVNNSKPSKLIEMPNACARRCGSTLILRLWCPRQTRSMTASRSKPSQSNLAIRPEIFCGSASAAKPPKIAVRRRLRSARLMQSSSGRAGSRLQRLRNIIVIAPTDLLCVNRRQAFSSNIRQLSCKRWRRMPGVRLPAWRRRLFDLDLHRFRSGQVLMLGGPLFEGHG